MIFKFIHAADLHLDSPLQTGALLDDPGGRLRQATFTAWDRLVQVCLDRQVAFLLLAGDVFDNSTRTLKALLAFRQGLERLRDADIAVFLIHGNHDPLDKWPAQFVLPANTRRLGAGGAVETALFPEGAPLVAISGICYPQQQAKANLARQFQAQHPHLFQIAMLHCACGDQPDGRYAPCRLSDLTSAAFDYWALGHSHAPECLSTSPWIGYAGCPQGRHPRETGRHGCWLVAVDSEQRRLASEPELIELDNLRWHELAVDISPVQSQLQLLDCLAGQVRTRCDQAPEHGHILRLTLTGRTSLCHQLRTGDWLTAVRDELREQLADRSPVVLIDALTNQTAPVIDLKQRAGTDDLVGQLLAVAAEISADPARLAELEQTLGPLWNHATLKRALVPLAPAQLQAWLEQATGLCVDLLESGDAQ